MSSILRPCAPSAGGTRPAAISLSPNGSDFSAFALHDRLHRQEVTDTSDLCAMGVLSFNMSLLCPAPSISGDQVLLLPLWTPRTAVLPPYVES